MVVSSGETIYDIWARNRDLALTLARIGRRLAARSEVPDGLAEAMVMAESQVYRDARDARTARDVRIRAQRVTERRAQTFESVVNVDAWRKDYEVAVR